jgi:hypothetical protein
MLSYALYREQVLYCRDRIELESRQMIMNESNADQELLPRPSPNVQPRAGDAWDADFTLTKLQQWGYFNIEDNDNVNGNNVENLSTIQGYEGWPIALVAVITGDSGSDGIMGLEAFGLMMSYFDRMSCSRLIGLRNFSLFDFNRIKQAKYNDFPRMELG